MVLVHVAERIDVLAADIPDVIGSLHTADTDAADIQLVAWRLLARVRQHVSRYDREGRQRQPWWPETDAESCSCPFCLVPSLPFPLLRDSLCVLTIEAPAQCNLYDTRWTLRHVAASNEYGGMENGALSR